MAPVALGVIGLRLHWDKNWLQSRFLWYGLGFRLLLAPGLVWGTYALLMPTSSLAFKVTVLESGMAPMITGALLAAQFGLQPRLASLLAGLGVPLSALSLLFWYLLLG
jgi:predicted permease